MHGGFRRKHVMSKNVSIYKSQASAPALMVPVFQCYNGHIACHICCPKLNNSCPLCALPIDIRCRGVENIVEYIIVPCQFAKLGCTETVPYGRGSSHEREYCRFSSCSCPECKYTGPYVNVFFHYLAAHPWSPVPFFRFGKPLNVQMRSSDKILVLTTLDKTILFVLQSFREKNGVYVTLNCIAPLVLEVETFVYSLSHSYDGVTQIHKSEIKKILEVRSQIPREEKLLFVSNRLLRGDVLEMELCISRLNEEEYII